MRAGGEPMLILLAVMLILFALLSLYVAVEGPPARRVSRDRVAAYAAVEQKSTLTKSAEFVEGKVEDFLRREGRAPFQAEELQRAGIVMPLASFIVLLGCIAVVCFGIGLVLLGSVVVGLLLAVGVPVVAKVWLRWKTGRVYRTFADQLPQALQLMAASLRAGHGFDRVLDAVAKEIGSPLGPELARAANETRLGRDRVEALDDVAVRMHSDDFHWVAAAIGAQRETGGNLNEILDQVAETIRERQHVRLQVLALSAEGRLSAVILMLLPVLIGAYYMLVAGDQMSTFIASGIGKLLLAGSLLAYVLGGLWMRSIVRIEF